VLDEATKDRHGNDMNIAFRIEGVQADAFAEGPKVSLPKANRLVASQAFLNACRNAEGDFGTLGKARLKGIGDDTELFLLVSGQRFTHLSRYDVPEGGGDTTSE
jgi:class 3 adenylate cyclase